jgi:hypothetical protein
VILDLIRSKEEAQAAIAEAAFRKERADAAKAAREAAEASQPSAAGVVPPVEVGPPQGAVEVLAPPQISPREAGIALPPFAEGSRPSLEGAWALDDRCAPESCQSPTGVQVGGPAELLTMFQYEGRDGGPVLPVSMCTRSKSQCKGTSRPLLSVRKGQNKRRGSK